MNKQEFLKTIFERGVYSIKGDKVFRKGGHQLKEGKTYNLCWHGITCAFSFDSLKHFVQTGEVKEVGFTEEEIKQIKLLLEFNTLQGQEIARLYDTDSATISLIKSGKIKAHKTGIAVKKYKTKKEV